MNLVFRRDMQELIFTSKGDLRRIPASSIVRNELNQFRKKNQVVYAIDPENVQTSIPVQPRPFPDGNWKITEVQKRSNKYTKPFVIMTNAWQILSRWELDEEGNYDHDRKKPWPDYQYYLHFSSSRTTLGCIRIHEINDLYWLVNQIQGEFLRLEKAGMKKSIDLIVC